MNFFKFTYIILFGLTMPILGLAQTQFVEFTQDEKVLVLKHEQLDTLFFASSTKKYYYLTRSQKSTSLIKTNKVNVFRFVEDDRQNVKIHFRYENATLIDDEFIEGEIMGYNENNFLLKYYMNNRWAYTQVHVSHIAKKDLKRWQEKN